MANEKVKLTQDQILANSGGKVTFTDAGGTLRVIKSSLVEVVDKAVDEPAQETDQGSESVDTPLPQPDPQAETPIGADPPASETTPPPEPAPAPQPKPARKKREKPMATAQTATKAKTPVKAKAPVRAAAKKRNTGNGEATGVRTIGGKPVNLENYEKAKAPGGGTSYHNGDQVAERLAGKTLDEVYTLAAKTLKEDEKALRAKYKHLNVGMQRMALGNRMRTVLIPKEAKN
jgi:outer membrane biosynthesis protein TonB